MLEFKRWGHWVLLGSITALRDFNGFLKASIIEKPPGVVAR
jgi:hypothetical protein